MSSDTKNLEKRGLTWYAVVEVPPLVRGKMGGKRRLKRSLKTGDLRQARECRHLVVAEFRQIITRARQALDETPAQFDLNAEALEWRDELKKDEELIHVL